MYLYIERERERERRPGRLSSFWAKHWPESRSLQDHVMDQPFQSTQKSIWASNPFEAFLYSSINPKQKCSASSFHELWVILIWAMSVCSSYMAIWVISLTWYMGWLLVFNIVFCLTYLMHLCLRWVILQLLVNRA